MDEIVKCSYTAELIKQVSRELLLPRLGRMLALIAIISVALILALGGITGFLVGVWVTLGLLLLGVLLGYGRQVGEQAKSLHQKTTLTLNEDSITLEHVDFTSIIKWRKVHSVKKLKRAWLLFYSDTGYVPIPAEVLSDYIKAWIDRKMSENHARIP